MEMQPIARDQPERCPHLGGYHQAALLPEYECGIHRYIMPRFRPTCHEVCQPPPTPRPRAPGDDSHRPTDLGNLVLLCDHLTTSGWTITTQDAVPGSPDPAGSTHHNAPDATFGRSLAAAGDLRRELVDDSAEERRHAPAAAGTMPAPQPGAFGGEQQRLGHHPVPARGPPPSPLVVLRPVRPQALGQPPRSRCRPTEIPSPVRASTYPAASPTSNTRPATRRPHRLPQRPGPLHPAAARPRPAAPASPETPAIAASNGSLPAGQHATPTRPSPTGVT